MGILSDSLTFQPLTKDEIRLHKEHRRKLKGEEEATVPVPEFLRSPATVPQLTEPAEFEQAANKYFDYCISNELQPQLTELVLAFGLPGVSSFHRLGRRRPELRLVLSRCVTAIAAGYERLLASSSSRGAIFALKHLPDFDLEEEGGSPEIPFWTDKQELTINSNIAGVQGKEDEWRHLTPEEAYAKIMRGGVPFKAIEDKKKKEKEINPLDKLTMDYKH